MSAWYVFASMGLYPVCPGQGSLSISSPNFERIRIRVKGGNFTIRCRNFTPENIYIQAALLNGRGYNRSWIGYEAFLSGGILELIMGPSPCKSWGSASDSVPPSLTKKPKLSSIMQPNLEPITVSAKIRNKGSASGTEAVCFSVNGQMEDAKAFTLAPGE
jgi:putative alpha-1,2-mannosidase